MLPKAHFLSAFAALGLLVACGDESSPAAPEPTPAKGMNGITITAPNGGETFKVGDSISVKWTSTEDVLSSAAVVMRCGSATTWTALTTGSIDFGTPSYGNLRAKIPGTLSGSCSIKIYDYQVQTNYDTTDTRFTVNP